MSKEYEDFMALLLKNVELLSAIIVRHRRRYAQIFVNNMKKHHEMLPIIFMLQQRWCEDALIDAGIFTVDCQTSEWMMVLTSLASTNERACQILKKLEIPVFIKRMSLDDPRLRAVAKELEKPKPSFAIHFDVTLQLR